MSVDRADAQSNALAPRLRVLAISPTFLPVQGGAERLLDEVLRRIAVHHDITLLTAEPPQRHAGPLPAGLPFAVHRYVDRWTLERLRGRRWHLGYAPPFSLSAAAAAVRLARASRPDVVHVHYAIPTGLAAWMAARAVRAPWVLSFVGRDIPGPGVPEGWRAWDRRMIAAADGVTYISDYCRQALFGNPQDDGLGGARGPGATGGGATGGGATGGGATGGGAIVGGAAVAGVTLGPGVTVGAGVTPPPAVPPEAVPALRRRLGIGGDRPVLLCLQRLVAYKGVEVLVDMMARLAEAAGSAGACAPAGSAAGPGDRAPVLLIAGSGPERERLVRRVEELGLADRVRLLGFVPDTDMPALWALADAFVFHSRYETFGLAVAEAMAAGKAVVAARTTAIPEVLRDGVDGLLVPPDDPDAFAGAVGGLLADPARRAAMGAAGQARARAAFSWDRVADDYRAMIERVAGRRD